MRNFCWSTWIRPMSLPQSLLRPDCSGIRRICSRKIIERTQIQINSTVWIGSGDEGWQRKNMLRGIREMIRSLLRQFIRKG